MRFLDMSPYRPFQDMGRAVRSWVGAGQSGSQLVLKPGKWWTITGSRP